MNPITFTFGFIRKLSLGIFAICSIVEKPFGNGISPWEEFGVLSMTGVFVQIS